MKFRFLIVGLLSSIVFCGNTARAAENLLATPAITSSIAAIEPKLIAWRRDIHQHPELSNREFRTAQIVAEHLRSLGLSVQTGVAHTGVVGLLVGEKPGPIIALRADMDALPVVEKTDLPFRSQVRTQFNGQEVGVMHACGHDAHVAILMATAEVLAQRKEQLAGTVKFIFQPAEEGAPAGERGGADLMIEQGVLTDPVPEAIFGLHVFPFPVGTLAYRSNGIMASSDRFSIRVIGKQTHGAVPWAGVDPIVVSAQIILGLQTIVSRQVDATSSPSIITVGMIQGGVRGNIIPDDVRMVGTIRTFAPDIRQQLQDRVKRTAEHIASSAGATAEVDIGLGNGVTFNDPALTERIIPSLRKVPGGKLWEVAPQTTAEDFSAYQQKIPGVFFFLGVAPNDLQRVHPNHSDLFYVDESALPIGVYALVQIALDYLGVAPHTP